MAVFNYEAVDARGRSITGEIEANSREDASAKLRGQGMFPTNVKQVSAGPATASAVSTKTASRGKFVFGGVSYKDLTVFTRQLATLLDAGLPIVRSLEVLEGQMRKPLKLKYALQDIIEDVSAGATLSEAMQKFPKIFDSLYSNMIRAGEAGGVLVPILERLADYMEKNVALRKKVLSALIYPAFVITIAIGVLVAIMIFVIPNFEKVFKDLSGKESLPMLTESVLGVSRFMVNYWYMLIAIPFLIWIFFKLVRMSTTGARVLDRLNLWWPILGNVSVKSNISRFCRTLGTLVASGVPILDALEIIRSATANQIFSDLVGKVHDNIRQGGAIAEPLDNTPIFDDMVVNMIKVGEETGELDRMLLRIADVYDDEVDNLVSGLVSILEPLIIVFMGLTVGTIVISLFLPLISMMNSLSQSGAR
ncbi:MAG: type II secretion system F family protein [Planctomycetota bacterium]|nr:type II secretion system F family protein [Planctomycetota bacterium]